jgi:phosphoglycolate phosphatase
MATSLDRRRQQEGNLICCVIYDCDGVLFDSLEANRRLYNHICRHMGRTPITPEELAYCHTRTVHQSIARLFGYDPDVEDRAWTFLKEEVDFRDYVQYLTMEPHLLDTLSALRGKGLKTAISTNRTTSMKHVMEAFKLEPYFDKVVTALDVAKPKPDPESVEIILRTLNLRTDQVLYVGDSEVDLGTARSSGVRFVAYKNKAISQGIMLEDHLDILTFLSNEESLRTRPCA